jgi:hypothetical protein
LSATLVRKRGLSFSQAALTFRSFGLL